MIESPLRAELGRRLSLRFSLFPGSFEVVFRGMVVRHTDEGFAIRFVELDASQRELLHRALPPSASA